MSYPDAKIAATNGPSRRSAPAINPDERPGLTTIPAKERLLTNPRFTFVAASYLSEITRDDVEVRLALNVISVPVRYPADTVVMVGFNESNRDLLDYYQNSPFAVHVVGDANGTRQLQPAIGGGAAVGRAV